MVQVCKGLRMRVVEMEKGVGYKVKVDEAESVSRNCGFGEERMEIWRTDGTDEELRMGFEQLVGLLGEEKKAP